VVETAGFHCGGWAVVFRFKSRRTGGVGERRGERTSFVGDRGVYEFVLKPLRHTKVLVARKSRRSLDALRVRRRAVKAVVG